MGRFSSGAFGKRDSSGGQAAVSHAEGLRFSPGHKDRHVLGESFWKVCCLLLSTSGLGRLESTRRSWAVSPNCPCCPDLQCCSLAMPRLPLLVCITRE